MAEKEQPAKEATKDGEVLILRKCHFGECGEIKALKGKEIDFGVAEGSVDPHPDALSARKAHLAKAKTRAELLAELGQ